MGLARAPVCGCQTAHWKAGDARTGDCIVHLAAAAQALGAGVVVPQFWAGMDRWWAPHKGRLPGATATPLPYKAPLDHILNLEHGFGRPLRPDEHGPDIPYREHSFLRNPRTPESVRSSVLRIEPCTAEADGTLTPGCADGSGDAEVRDDAVRLQPHLTDVQLRAALRSAAASYKVLHFAAMNGTFARFEAEADGERFARRIRQAPSLWCCARPPPGRPGHVWYDLQWDTMPHTDLHNQQWVRPWNVTLGP